MQRSRADRRRSAIRTAVLLSAAILVGCAPVQSIGKVQTIMAMETVGAFEGVWLRSAAAEAFVAVRPYPRLLVFRSSGRASPLADHCAPFVGVRTWFMEPAQDDRSPGPAGQPAAIVCADVRQVTVLAEPDMHARVQTGMQVILDPNRPRLTLRHFMINRADVERRLAVWSITALAKAGRIVAPFGDNEPLTRTVTWFSYTCVDDPAFQIARRAMSLDVSADRRKATKIGVRTAAGWVAHVRGVQVLRSRVAFDPAGEYPEGGSNITCFVTQSPQQARTWCEMEQVGPLQTVAPGGRAWLVEQMELLELSESVPLDEPDRLRAAIEAAATVEAPRP